MSTIRSFSPQARKWQWLALVSGLVLGSCAFLTSDGVLSDPNMGVAPIASCLSLLKTVWSSNAMFLEKILRCFVAFWQYFGAYLCGLLVAIAIAGRLTGVSSVRRAMTGTLLCLYLLFAAGVPTAYLSILVLNARYMAGGTVRVLLSRGAAQDMFSLQVPVICLVYGLAALRLRGRVWLSCMFILDLIALGRFVYAMIALASAWLAGPSAAHTTAFYVLYFSLAASIGLLIAVIGEAAMFTRQSWGRTIWQLLTCRLVSPAATKGRCPDCDYLLYGLTEQRCPECGRVFAFEEIGATPEEMGSQSERPP